jgi:hypothetical protein
VVDLARGELILSSTQNDFSNYAFRSERSTLASEMLLFFRSKIEISKERATEASLLFDNEPIELSLSFFPCLTQH